MQNQTAKNALDYKREGLAKARAAILKAIAEGKTKTVAVKLPN